MSKPVLRPFTSTLLDVLRLCAAGVVLLSHLAQFWWTSAYRWLEPLSHAAVVLFFVLSGYLVTWSTQRLDTAEWREFVVSRLARLWSVVLPALAVTAVIHAMGSLTSPDFYLQMTRGPEWVRYLLNALFLQNIWMFSASPPSNGPLWSLGYEFWFYAAYGAYHFVRPGLPRWSAVAVCLALAGPNIALLMPCWLLGHCLARMPEAVWAWWQRLAYTGLGVSLAGAVLVWAPRVPKNLDQAPLHYSGAFLSDWLVAMGVAAAILGLRSVAPRASSLSPESPRLRRWAELSFPVYAFHFPVIVLMTAWFGFPDSLLGLGWRTAVVVAVVMVTSWVNARGCRFWYRLVRALIMRLAPSAATEPASALPSARR